MILDSLSRKKGLEDIPALLRYIDNPDKATGDAFFWGLSSELDLGEIEKRFLENLTPPRKGGVYIRHFVMSFSGKDGAHLTDTVLLDMARQWLVRGYPRCLAYVRIHRDTNNPHVHMAVSANERRSEKRPRMSRKQFADLKQELESYQRSQYPELKHSTNDHGKKKRLREQGREEIFSEIPETQTTKQRLSEQVHARFDASVGLQDFCDRLREAGLEPYERGGKLTGIWAEKKTQKFRFRTLKLDLTPLIELEAFLADLEERKIQEREAEYTLDDQWERAAG